MKVITIIKISLWVVCALLPNVLWAGSFQTELEQSNWRYQGDKFSCQIAHDISRFGEISLVARPDASLTLNLNSQWLNFEKAHSFAQVVVPSWHQTQHESFPTFKFQAKNKQQTSVADDKLGLYLKAIAKGYTIEVTVDNRIGEQFSGIANSVNSQNVIEQFRHCYAQLLPKPYSYVRRIDLIFDSGSSQLNSQHEQDLNAIVEYVQADSTIERILVDAHTDGNGHHLANLVLSKERADEVASRLVELGLAIDMVDVRHHGERMPLVANSTEKGRSINRRVTVKLVKHSQGVNQ
ncbi:OmpA family protein [Shewanella sp. 202IG2-18]|uniref:MotY family protein n=1 Tax=Parashewanella hymeniacidonis TaxID=2807618 RepID=UPI001960DF37|nr:OmpA family protein [Parashewanella hymeniacidonis]MBM7071620.1 OmpA family protein [Parashewanella hymeniacidonis]